MPATLDGMAKSPANKGPTEQVRVPVDVMNNVRMTAPSFNEQPHEYVTRAVRDALRRDMAKAAKLLAKRAAEQGGAESE